MILYQTCWLTSCDISCIFIYQLYFYLCFCGLRVAIVGHLCKGCEITGRVMIVFKRFDFIVFLCTITIIVTNFTLITLLSEDKNSWLCQFLWKLVLNAFFTTVHVCTAATKTHKCSTLHWLTSLRFFRHCDWSIFNWFASSNKILCIDKIGTGWFQLHT